MNVIVVSTGHDRDRGGGAIVHTITGDDRRNPDRTRATVAATGAVVG